MFIKNIAGANRKIFLTLVLFSLAAAACSSIFLSGWRGSQGSTDSLIFAFILFCLNYSLFTFFTHKVDSFKAKYVIIWFVCSAAILSITASSFDLVIAALVMISVLGVGNVVLIRHPQTFTLSFGLGLFFLIALSHIFSHFNLLRLFLIFYIVFGTLGFIFSSLGKVKNFGINLHKLKNQPSALDNYNPILTIALLSSLQIYAIASLSPPLGYDALNIKAWLPNQWYHNSEVFLPLDHILTGISGSFSYPLVLANVLGAELSGSAIQLCIFLVFISKFSSWVSKFFANSVPIAFQIFCLVILSTPALLWQFANSYDDVWNFSFVGLILLELLKLPQNETSHTLMMKFGSLAGLLLLVKLSLFPFAIAVTILALLSLGKHDIELLRKIRLFSTYCTLAVIFGSPVLIWKWISYGNPVWPLYNSLFKAPSLPATDIQFNFPYYNLDLQSLILSPATTLLNPSLWTEEGAPGVYGSLYTLGLICVVILIRRMDYAGTICFVTLCSFYLSWFSQYSYLRFTLLILPVILISAALIYVRMDPDWKWISRSPSLFLIVCLMLTSLPIGNPISSQRIPYKVTLGIQSKELYLLENIRAMPAILWMNSNLPKDSIIGTLGMYERLYLRSDLDAFLGWEITPGVESRLNYFLEDKMVTSDTKIPDSFSLCEDVIFQDEQYRLLTRCTPQ
jgi:hypothetical protein